jgi:hypothetical protein
MKHVIYPSDAGTIIDITKAPYFADNTGKNDCTGILVGILDELAGHSIAGMNKLVEIIKADPSPDVKLPNSFENKKVNGVTWGIFPYAQPPSRIIYFPKGTYLISDTICYSMDNLKNSCGNELNWCIRFQGESREESVIRLKDHCRGFEYGMARPAISFMRGERSNVAMSNYFRNLTIDVGQGNPGAIGLDFFGSNCAAVRDVTIRSSDPQGRGMAGLTISRDGFSGCMLNNVAIHGFDVGLKLNTEGYLVGEHIELDGQRSRGLIINGPIVSIRGLRSHNKNPAILVKGHFSHVVLLDSEFSGGPADAPAIEHHSGQLFLRNIRSQDYLCVLGTKYAPGGEGDSLGLGTFVDEYISHPVVVMAAGQSRKSLGFTVAETPDVPWDLNFEHWIHPGMVGAVGDGVTDDTAAIQRAMDSGKSVIYFQPGRYVINVPVRIPETVRHINFMFVDLVAGKDLQAMKDCGMFTVAGESPEPLLMEDLFSFEMNYGHHYLVDHATTRTLIMRDIHSQSCASYRNSVAGGTVFTDNITTTTGICNDTYQHPCFVFTGQKAWCRQLNPEYTPDKVINDGGQLFVFGFKTEGEGIAFTTKNGGASEILGGVLHYGANNDIPAVLNDASDVSFIASTSGSFSHHLFKIAVKEIKQGHAMEAGWERFPVRFGSQYAIPLYVGRINVSYEQ